MMELAHPHLTCVVLQDPITWKQIYVVAISVGTIGLWCANTALSKYTGQMGIVAIVPMVAFFGFGLLSKVSAAVLFPLPSLWSPALALDCSAKWVQLSSLHCCIAFL